MGPEQATFNRMPALNDLEPTLGLRLYDKLAGAPNSADGELLFNTARGVERAVVRYEEGFPYAELVATRLTRNKRTPLSRIAAIRSGCGVSLTIRRHASSLEVMTNRSEERSLCAL